MNCMKCGKEISPEAAFCESCLADMSNYPVKPDTVVQLPVRKEEPPARRNSRRRNQISEQEQIKQLKIHLQRIWMAFAISLLLLAVAVTAAVYLYRQNNEPQVGQNYSTVTTKSTSED